jgi:hypothetical protein
MFLSNLNTVSGVFHSISEAGVFLQHPAFLSFTLLAILFTALMTRYDARQKADKLVRETRKRNSQVARQMRQQHELLHQMMQNKSDKI